MPAPLYPLQPTFARGEISPRLFSRADLDHWKMALAECVNFLILKQGGLRRRPGTEWISRAKVLGEKVRLIPFTFSIEQAYVIELGSGYARFYANGGIVNKNIATGITFNTTTDKVNWTAHGLSDGDPVFFSTTSALPGGITEGVTYYIINKGTNDFQIALTVGGAAINLTGAAAGTITAVAPFELATPWNITEIWELQYSQSADVLYVTHGTYAPRKITRTSGSVFTIEIYVQEDGPYLPQNTTATTLDPSGNGPGNLTITASDVIGINDDAGWDATDVGRHVTILYSAKWYWYKITAVGLNDGTVTIDIPTDVFTAVAHGATIGGEIKFSTTGALPTGLVAGTIYFIKTVPTADTFTVSATAAGAAINVTGTQSGVHSFVLEPRLTVRVHLYGLVDDEGETKNSTSSHGPRSEWRLGAWCEMCGWPSTVGFFQQRLVFGRTAVQPQTIWMTKAGVLDNFSTTEPAQADDAITITVLAGEVNAIQWIREGKDLIMATTGAMRTVGQADQGRAFSGNNLTQQQQSNFGAKAMQPIMVGSVAIYASYYGKSLREFVYSFQQNSYIAPELSILSEHMMKSGIVQMTYAQEPDSVVWCAMGNGELVGVTYERDQNIVAMTRHRLGGELLASGIVDPADPTDPDTHYGVVESVAAIPGDGRSEVWVSVKRTINGETIRYVERFTQHFENMQKEDAVFVDSSFSYDSTAASSLTGATWLKGEEISMLADGSVESLTDVSSVGGITLPSGRSCEKITFGLPYTSRVKTLPIAMGVGDGTGMGRKKNLVAAKVDYMETGYLEAGSAGARTLEVAVGKRGATDAMDTSPPLVDGFRDVKFDQSWLTHGQIILETDKPLPVTIRSITPVFDGEP